MTLKIGGNRWRARRDMLSSAGTIVLSQPKGHSLVNLLTRSSVHFECNCTILLLFGKGSAWIMEILKDIPSR